MLSPAPHPRDRQVERWVILSLLADLHDLGQERVIFCLDRQANHSGPNKKQDGAAH